LGFDIIGFDAPTYLDWGINMNKPIPNRKVGKMPFSFKCTRLLEQNSSDNGCKICWGYGFWAIGKPYPMGRVDAGDGIPTIACPECGANANPWRAKK